MILSDDIICISREQDHLVIHCAQKVHIIIVSKEENVHHVNHR